MLSKHARDPQVLSVLKSATTFWILFEKCYVLLLIGALPIRALRRPRRRRRRQIMGAGAANF